MKHAPDSFPGSPYERNFLLINKNICRIINSVWSFPKRYVRHKPDWALPFYKAEVFK